ncbi:response regulator [Paenibacillus algorifonticola]|uniref:response regulator transcription factor n=1 Tax=Paenibacillus algorifonticola TaxID=684063 RepID=UPI003D28DBA8
MFQILVAEDEMWIRTAIVEMIERFDLGFKVVAEANDGKEAWNLVNEFWPNVIITDIVMPHMDGLSLIQKCDEYKLSIVPIVISGYENFNYAQQAMRYGATEYLLKPVAAEDLKRALQRSVERLQNSHHLHEPLHKIQRFVENIEVWDHQRLIREVTDIIQFIMKLKTPNPGVMSGLFRILSNKLNEQLESIISGYQMTDYEHNKDQEVVKQYFYKLLEEWSRTLHVSQASNKNRLLMKRVYEYVQQNYVNEITLTHISEYVELSVSRFCVLFKQSNGDSFVNYLNLYRIEKAKQLLLEPDLKVYEVAEMVGFGTLPYFNRLFKSIMNQSPNEYRRSLGL